MQRGVFRTWQASAGCWIGDSKGWAEAMPLPTISQVERIEEGRVVAMEHTAIVEAATRS
jgi:hypothetical protein